MKLWTLGGNRRRWEADDRGNITATGYGAQAVLAHCLMRRVLYLYIQQVLCNQFANYIQGQPVTRGHHCHRGLGYEVTSWLNYRRHTSVSSPQLPLYTHLQFAIMIKTVRAPGRCLAIIWWHRAASVSINRSREWKLCVGEKHYICIIVPWNFHSCICIHVYDFKSPVFSIRVVSWRIQIIALMAIGAKGIISRLLIYIHGHV